MGDESSVDAILDLVQSTQDCVLSLDDRVEDFRQYVRREFWFLRLFVLFWLVFTLLGVSAVLFEVGRLRGVL